MRFIRVTHAKMVKKRTPEIRQKPLWPTRKNRTKSTICYGDRRNNANFKKNSKKYDLLGQLSQKIKNHISRFALY